MRTAIDEGEEEEHTKGGPDMLPTPPSCYCDDLRCFPCAASHALRAMRCVPCAASSNEHNNNNNKKRQSDLVMV